MNANKIFVNNRIFILTMVMIITLTLFASVVSADFFSPHSVSGFYVDSDGEIIVGVPLDVHVRVCVGLPCVEYNCTTRDAVILTFDNGGYYYTFSDNEDDELVFDFNPSISCDNSVSAGDLIWSTPEENVDCTILTDNVVQVSAGGSTFVGETVADCPGYKPPGPGPGGKGGSGGGGGGGGSGGALPSEEKDIIDIIYFNHIYNPVTGLLELNTLIENKLYNNYPELDVHIIFKDVNQRIIFAPSDKVSLDPLSSRAIDFEANNVKLDTNIYLADVNVFKDGKLVNTRTFRVMVIVSREKIDDIVNRGAGGYVEDNITVDSYMYLRGPFMENPLPVRKLYVYHAFFIMIILIILLIIIALLVLVYRKKKRTGPKKLKIKI